MSDLTGVPPFSPSPAPSQTACGFCGRPITDQYFEFMGKITCPTCAAGVVKMADLNQPDTAAMLRGAMFGLCAAVFAGVIWGLLYNFGHIELGIVAVGVGWAVSRAIQIGSGGRRGQHMQAMAICIAVFGIVFGKLMIPFIFFYQQEHIGEAVQSIIQLLRTEPLRVFGAFDLVWLFIAVLRPFQAFKPLNLRIRGPFSLSAGPVQALQFDRALPITPKPPAGPVA